MNERDTYLGTVRALAEFIQTNRIFLMPGEMAGSDRSYEHDPRYTMQDLATLAERMDREENYRFWNLSTSCLGLFLRKAPELREVVAPVSITGLHFSRETSFDPLTYAGLSDVLHFINNGLLDDLWLAAYRRDGEMRIVNETVDDAIRSGKPSEGLKWRGRLDKSDDWLRGAERTYLDHHSFAEVFREELDGLEVSVPDQDQLMELWMTRAYEDFAPSPRP